VKVRTFVDLLLDDPGVMHGVKVLRTPWSYCPATCVNLFGSSNQRTLVRCYGNTGSAARVTCVARMLMRRDLNGMFQVGSPGTPTRDLSALAFSLFAPADPGSRLGTWKPRLPGASLDSLGARCAGTIRGTKK
jgi:hypothetical protein